MAWFEKKPAKDKAGTAEAARRQIPPGEIDDILRLLSQRIRNSQPQMSFLNERLRSYELMALNIKQLGYELARQMTQSRLQRHIASAPDTRLGSTLCTQADIESDWFAFWCGEMRSAPCYHRKLWELCYITQALWTAGKLAPGAAGLGFGCGREPLPSLFAKYGVKILATDLDPSRPEAKGWQDTEQHGSAAEGFRDRRICADEGLLANIAFQPVDMNQVPQELGGRFDFCWSACALEHLGSIDKGLAFIEASLRTLKPGGVAVHTTEFNLESGETIDNWGTVLFQKHHIVDFAGRLAARGYRVEPLNLEPGSGVLDGFVDIPPWGSEALQLLDSPAHLKLSVDGFPCTSVGLIVQAPPA